MEKDLEIIYKDLYPNSQAVCGFGNPIKYLGIKDGESVIDLGCGGGKDCFSLSELTSGQIVGVDIQKRMVEYAQHLNNKGINFIQSDFLKLDFEDNSFDCVISNCAFLHVEEKSQIIKEVFRILKKGGKLCFSDLTIKEKTGGKNLFAIQSDEYFDILRTQPFEEISFVKEEAIFYNLHYKNIYCSTFICNK